MAIGKAWRLGGFIAALGASGALIASATGATGAYFTDSHNGTISANSGHLSLSVSGSTALDFSNLMPGTPDSKSIGYTTHVSSGTEDVWMVFPAGTPYELFTGAKDDGVGGGLGRYGFFAVSDSNFGQAFRSHNLANRPAGDTSTTDFCGVDTNGRGGSDQTATKETDTPPYCGVPHAILLAWNLADGSTGNITVDFGLSGRQTQQGQVEFGGSVPFQIVATQHGIRPDAGNF